MMRRTDGGPSRQGDNGVGMGVWGEALTVWNQFHMMSDRLSWNHYEKTP